MPLLPGRVGPCWWLGRGSGNTLVSTPVYSKSVSSIVCLLLIPYFTMVSVYIWAGTNGLTTLCTGRAPREKQLGWGQGRAHGPVVARNARKRLHIFFTPSSFWPCDTS